MFQSLSGLWKARQGRKAAVAAILPLVQGSRARCQGIAERTWLDPYMVGFMMMLITLVARHKVNGMDGLFLGLVQQEAWADITGMRPELIGERALHLSASGNRTFTLGCQNAVTFEAALNRRAQDDALFDVADFRRHARDDELIAGLDGQNIVALWADCFESHVIWEYP